MAVPGMSSWCLVPRTIRCSLVCSMAMIGWVKHQTYFLLSGEGQVSFCNYAGVRYPTIEDKQQGFSCRGTSLEKLNVLFVT